MTQVGRPQGELKGETPQADELAQWLRVLTRGVSQRDLAQLLHIGKTLCGEYLNGSKLIPEDMIDRIVDAFVPDTRLREQRRDAGRLRRQRAVEAAQGKPSVPPQLQRARTQAELHLQLDDARRGQLAAQEKTFQAEQMVGVLLSLVASLQERCTRLEAERERAASVVRGELQHELEQSELRLESARTLLEEARREREQAEEIRLAAHRLVERERQALKDAEEEPRPAADSQDAAEPGVTGLRLEDLGLAALHDVDRVLDASSAQLAAQAQELDALGEHVGLAPRARTTPTPQTPAIARALAAGNAANPLASSNTGRDQAAAEWEAARRQALANVAAAMSAALASRREAAAVVLLLISQGYHDAAAGMMTASYPQGGAVLGEILADIGRRTPGGVADLLDAVTEQFGNQTAGVYRQALQDADAKIATAVQAVPRTRPDLIEPPVPAGPETGSTSDVMQQTPQEIEGHRRARQVRAGGVAQVVAEIMAEATPQPDAAPPDEPTPLFSIGASTPSAALDIERVWQLVKDVCQQDPDDDIILASILTQMIAAGHPELAVTILRAVHGFPDEGPGYVQAIQKRMKRPELLSAFEHLATGKTRTEPATLQLLLAQAPPHVTANFLLKRDPSTLRRPIDICALPRLGVILRSMTEMNAPAAALLLARQIMSWDNSPGTEDDNRETQFASAFLALARADSHGTGRLFHAFFGQSPAEASRLLSLLRTHEDSAAVDTTAHALSQALQRDPTGTAGFIARALRDHPTAYQILDRVAQGDASHATHLARAMIFTDLQHFKYQLPTMLEENALALAAEMLQQLSIREPEGPWQNAAQYLKDAEPESARWSLVLHLTFRP